MTSDLSPSFSPGGSTGRQPEIAWRGPGDALDCSARFRVAYLLRLSCLQEPGPGFQREWPAELMRDCPKLAAESPHNSKLTLQGLLLGAVARAWGSLFLRCRYEHQHQSDEPHHDHAPCWLVCLNARHPNRSTPISEGSPSTWRRASTQADLTRRNERESPRGGWVCLYPLRGQAHACRRATLPWVTDRVAALRAWVKRAAGGAHCE